ncbi:unnamed protein product [Owenia fusiformis]|uniref:RanBP-type and C3HC4-type zinc finger-containing protein 1 n=2 Tax=Owenia fusiformis TaxID=6347 RepID=A0A8J1TSW8_OWEFU|nr:unnamed protein product [Owenia fusiformis]
MEFPSGVLTMTSEPPSTIPKGTSSLASHNPNIGHNTNKPHLQPKVSPGNPGHQHTAEMQSLVSTLENAIKKGDTLLAQKIVSLLAGYRLNLQMEVKDKQGVDDLDKEIWMKVYIEDQKTTVGPKSIKVQPSMTIKDLKNKIFLDFDFPPAIQQWIIDKKITKDHMTLAECGARIDDCTVFLYLLSAKSVGLKWEAARKQYERLSATGSIDEEDQDPGKTLQGPMISPPPIAAPRKVAGTPGAEGGLPVKPQVLAGQQHKLDNMLHEIVQGAGALVGAVGGAEGGAVGGIDPPSLEVDPNQEGWVCEVCTYFNRPLRPGCEMCSTDRPTDYKVPTNYRPTSEEKQILESMLRSDEQTKMAEITRQEKKLREQQENLTQLLSTDERDLITNTEDFECLICYNIVEEGEGVVLRECLHTFCRECLEGMIEVSEDAVITCPFQDNDYACNGVLQEREIKQLVPPGVYERHLQRSLATAEGQETHSFHCKTADCKGWCIYEDDVNFFNCPVCGNQNCLTCKAIHKGINCRQYQEDIRIRAANDIAAQQTQKMLQDMITSGEAMYCPSCKIVVLKKDGCDWIKCSMCKTEICWVTKGPRWGPGGSGDISGGCRCRVAGQQCHPNCNNCH